MPIHIEKDIPLKSSWVQSFLEISRAWDAVAEQNQVSIEGNLNAYGMQFEMELDGVHYIGRRKQESIRSESSLFVLKPNPFSEMLTIKGQMKEANTLRFELVKDNFYNTLRSFFLRSSPFSVTEDWIIHSNQNFDALLEASTWLIQNTNLDYLKIAKREFEIRLVGIPSTEEDIEVLGEVVSRLFSFKTTSKGFSF